MPGKELKEFTREEVAKHNTKESTWIIIDTRVYDLTRFSAMHPGGEGVILEVAGKEATDQFYGLHRQSVLNKYGPKYLIGTIVGEKPQIEESVPGTISKVPYGEPSWQQKGYSPYYNESHKKLRDFLRKFTDEHIIPEAITHEDLGKPPSKELWQKMGAAGIHALRLGPGKHLGLMKLPAGITPETYDYFHEFITHEELCRVMCRGYQDGLGGGMVIGLPPVLNYGSQALRDKIVPEVLSGNKHICLAISEPGAGSDVAGMQATAVKTKDGKHFIVNGVKKWITNGSFADYFSTACKTDKGYTMLLIERGEGVETKIMNTSYSKAGGTAYITFENVKVPVENVLGKENKGFAVIMSNFNHERWAMCVGTTRAARTVVEECFKWANQRVVFGKKLIEQPVIRQKLAKMIAMVEANQSWLESITFQMTRMSYAEQAANLAGPIALLKYQCTRTSHMVSDDACQLFGGRAITKTGMGRVVEMFQRTYKFDAILGGSEEILADLGIRQAMRDFPNARL